MSMKESKSKKGLLRGQCCLPRISRMSQDQNHRPTNDDFYDDTAKRYLQLSRDQMEKLTPEQCAEAALLLASLSFHIQRSYNREIARVNWADRTLKTTLVGREQAYKGSWESQFNQILTR